MPVVEDTLIKNDIGPAMSFVYQCEENSQGTKPLIIRQWYHI